MNDLVLANRAGDGHRLKALVLDSVSSPITKRVYNLGLDEFIEWFGLEPRPGFTKATVNAWRGALEARGLSAVSINVWITAVRKLALEATDNGLLEPELAARITRVKGAKSKGVRLGNWLSLRQARALLNAPDTTTKKGLRDRAILAILLGCGLRRSEVAALKLGHIQQRDNRWCIIDLVGLGWNQVDLEAREVRLQGAQAKAKRPPDATCVRRHDRVACVAKQTARKRLRSGVPLEWHAARLALEGLGSSVHRGWAHGPHFHDLRRSAIRNMERAGIPRHVAM